MSWIWCRHHVGLNPKVPQQPGNKLTCNNADGIWTSLISLQYVKTTQNLSYFPWLECHKNGLDKKISNHLHVHWLLSLHNYPNAQENKLLCITWQVSHYSTDNIRFSMCEKYFHWKKSSTWDERRPDCWWVEFNYLYWMTACCLLQEGWSVGISATLRSRPNK